MNYQQPEIVVLPSASAAVQGMTKSGASAELNERPTVSAYEADE